MHYYRIITLSTLLGDKLEDSLYTALEDDIESFCDILFDNGSGLSLEELVSFINGVGVPCTYNSWNAARNDIMTKNKLIGVLTRMVNTQLPEYIKACLSVDNAYVRLFNGSKDNLFYKNGHVAVARVDIKEDRVVFPQYGNLEICSIHGSAKKERVVYHTISDVVGKGYTSNSGSDLVLPILSKDKFRINLSDDKKSWVEYKDSAFLCIDTSKLFTFNNIMCIRDDCNVQYKDFKQYTSKVVNDFVQEVFYLGGVQDEEYMVRLLQHCGISGVNMSNLYDYINDTSTYNLVLEVVLDEIRTFLTDVIYEKLNTDNLYKSTSEDTKGVFFINRRYLGVVAVYLNKMINEVVLPNSCQLEKCDIFTGRNCHSDTISNYIKRGWKLPMTIDIDKQFKFREHSGYFITMNNW